METMQTIVPDIGFIEILKKDSKAPLKECMQCGTCSVVCKLSPDEKPFPRKEMIWASWGLKNKLLGNPDVWLCHQCGDCSTHCPRGVKPADVLSSVRNLSYTYYARPKFLGVWLRKPAYLPLVILFPAIIIMMIIYMAGTLTIPEGEVDYSKFFPHAWLNSSFTGLTVLVGIGVLIGVKKFWVNLKENLPGKRKISLFKSFMLALKDIGSNRKFNSCETNRLKGIAHAMVLMGFILLLMVTLVAIINVIFFEYPMQFWHPAKIAGNFASLLLFFGIGIMMYNRLFNKSLSGNSNYFDWFFLITLFLLTLSGTLTEAARFNNWQLAYHIYFFHLLMVWMVIIYAPFSKFGHFIYRSLAMIYARSIGR